MKTSKSYSQLIYKERLIIEEALEQDNSYRKVVQELLEHGFTRSLSSIYLEISRNGGPDFYSAAEAEFRAMRVKFRRHRKIDLCPALKSSFKKFLRGKMPPAQIAHLLKQQGFEICTQSIYNYMKANKLRQHLPKGGKRYNYNKGGKPNHSRMKWDFRPYSQRAPAYRLRKEFGHLELDMVMSKGNKDGLLTLLEMKTRYYCAWHMSGKNNAEVLAHLQRFIRWYKYPIKSITVDQGMEFYKGYVLERKLNSKVYYCDPGAPYQKGANERFNGVLRRYCPKETYFKDVSAKQLQQICKWIQQIPLNVLGGVSPLEAFRQELAYCST